ncbi:MAG: hypothetical protein ACKV2O_16225 [Acidimicrobiales bacterium]
MELAYRVFGCERCGREFEPKALGRRPLYCSRTCRQRAYEARRRAAVHHRLLTPTLTPVLPSGVPSRRPPVPPRYEGGRNRKILHALRPDGPANHNGERPTLCGTYCLPHPGRRYFGDPQSHQRPCRTCDEVTGRFPLTHPIDPSADLSHLKHVLAGGLHGFLTDNHHRQTATLLFLYRLVHPQANLPIPNAA